jgi:hypothetical protein
MFLESYNKADKKWATWVASVLEDQKRYTTIFQERDFRPGENFVLRMQEAMRDSERTMAVLSNHYLAALFTQIEWTSAFKKDPTGKQRALIPVRVEPCELPAPFDVLIYCDLVGLDEESAEKALLAAASPAPVPSQTRPPFPGRPKASLALSPAAGAKRSVRRDDREAARLLLDTLESTYVTFEAQADVRNTLMQLLVARFPGSGALQYEDLFSRHFGEMTPDERRLHEAMRHYTVQAMSEYNNQALNLIREHPGLKTSLPRLVDLEHHLDVWMDKYTNKFLPAPHMALCYVGVHENVPFPLGIEDELRAYLDAKLP